MLSQSSLWVSGLHLHTIIVSVFRILRVEVTCSVNWEAMYKVLPWYTALKLDSKVNSLAQKFQTRIWVHGLRPCAVGYCGRIYGVYLSKPLHTYTSMFAQKSQLITTSARTNQFICSFPRGFGVFVCVFSTLDFRWFPSFSSMVRIPRSNHHLTLLFQTKNMFISLISPLPDNMRHAWANYVRWSLCASLTLIKNTSHFR